MDLAVNLEKGTGVCRESWIWPERHWNPYIPLGKATSCLTCLNIASRMWFTAKRIVKMVDAADDKPAFILTVPELIHGFNGFTNAVTIKLREVITDGWKLLACVGDCEGQPELVTKNMSPWIIDKLIAGETVSFMNLPYDIPETEPLDRELTMATQQRSALILQREPLTFILYSSNIPMFFSDTYIEAIEYLVSKMAKSWIEAT